jgi:hypothetical protein
VAQGYYISRPLPALVFGEWLETGWHPRSERAA